MDKSDFKGIYLKGRQIRTWIPVKTYQNLKKESKKRGIPLLLHAGMILANHYK